MNQRHQAKLERYAGQLRFVLDLVCEMTDERLTDKQRMESATKLADRGDDFHQWLGECREVFRNISNAQTDAPWANDENQD